MKTNNSRMPMTRVLRLVVLGLTTLCASACQVNSQDATRIGWINSLLDASYEIDAQIFRLATDRDAVMDGMGDPLGNCDPRVAKATYEQVSTSLNRAMENANDVGLADEHQKELKAILEAWLAIQRKHNSLWNESEGVVDIKASERCLRSSAVVEQWLVIKKNLTVVLKAVVDGH